MEKEEQKMSELTIHEHEDPRNPKNTKLVHEIIIDQHLEQTKDFTGLHKPQGLGIHLNKSMKLVRHFRKPELNYNDHKVSANPKIDEVYMNTYRNGFVSAVAMSYNYHMPLILSPNDVWLAVLQGFKLHMQMNADKEFMKLTFKQLKKLDSHINKAMKITDDSLGNLYTCKQEKLEEALFDTIDKVAKKMWDDKHKSKEFAPHEIEHDRLLPVEKISDMFSFHMTSAHDLYEADMIYKKANYEEQKEKHFYGEAEKPEEVKEMDPAKLKVMEIQCKRQVEFYNTMFHLGTLDTSLNFKEAKEEKKNCGIPKVRFLGTLRDWRNLRRRILYLDRYGCHKWLDALLPVINKFINAIQCDEIDRNFWNHAYTSVPCKTATSTNKVHGWICNFFPYVGQPGELREQFAHLSTAREMFRERSMNFKTFQIDDTDFTRGVQLNKISINDKELTLASGFVGVEIENEVMDPKYPDEFLQYVKPAVGWFLYQEDPTKKKDHPNVFLSAETSGSLF